MASEMSDRERALNPDTPLDDLLKLAKQFPDEFLQNPIFDILNLENPAWVSRLSGEAQLALLLSEKCPQWMLDIFEIGEVTIQAAEDYDQGSHYFDCLFEGYRIRLTGESAGKAWWQIKLPRNLTPYFIEALSAKADSVKSNSPYDFPEATAFISAAMQHQLAEVNDITNDTRYFSAPYAPNEATAYLLSEESDYATHITMIDILDTHKIYRDPSDLRWNTENNSEEIKNLASRFFDAYDQNELSYLDWYNHEEDTRRPWIPEEIETVQIHCRADNSEKHISIISVDKLIKLNHKIGNLNQEIGVLLDIYPDSYSILSEIILDSGDSAADLALSLEDLHTINAQDLFAKFGESYQQIEDHVIKWFTKLGGKILDNLRILKVSSTDRVEILINLSNESRNDLFPEVERSGYQPWNDISDPDARYRAAGGEWCSLNQLMEELKHNQTLRDRLIYTVLSHPEDSWECNLRMTSSTSSIHGSMGCDFSADTGLTVGITQCLPVSSDEYLCFEQSYEEGEYETGIMTPYWNGKPGHQGGYSHLPCCPGKVVET